MIPDLIRQFDSFGECVILDKVTRSDSEGGIITAWQDGATFEAAVELDSSPEMKFAMAQGVKGVYTVTTAKPIRLPWHTVFRRIKDGGIFRVTSRDDKAAPEGSAIQTRIVTAEEWELPYDE